MTGTIAYGNLRGIKCIGNPFLVSGCVAGLTFVSVLSLDRTERLVITLPYAALSALVVIMLLVARQVTLAVKIAAIES